MDRNRAVYRRGEVAPLHVAIHLREAPAAPVQATLSLALQEAGARPFPLASVPVTLTGDLCTLARELIRKASAGVPAQGVGRR